MPILQFKGKTAIECYHHTVPHHTLEFDTKLPVLGKGETPGLHGIRVEGLNEDNLLLPGSAWCASPSASAARRILSIHTQKD